MKTVYRLFSVLLVLLVAGPSLRAAPIGADSTVLTPQQLDDFKIRAGDMIGELQRYIAIIADSSNSLEDRNDAIRRAMKLFKPNSTMQVSNLLRPSDTRRTYPVRQYLENLKALGKGLKIQITNYQPVYVSEWQRQPDGTYAATGKYFQEFKSWKNGKPRYADRTEKIVDLGLGYWRDPFFQDKKWMVLLGNVEVNSTELIQKF